jgi:hypothetical protein
MKRKHQLIHDDINVFAKVIEGDVAERVNRLNERITELDELLLAMSTDEHLACEFAKKLRSDIDQVNDRLTLHIGHRGIFAHGTLPEPDYKAEDAAGDWMREQAGQ